MAASWEGQTLDAVVAYLKANPTALSAALAQSNTSVATVVEGAATALLSKVPIIGPIVSSAIVGAGPQLVTFLGTEENQGEAYVISLLQAEAAKFGG
jgi:HEAT repeat protein